MLEEYSGIIDINKIIYEKYGYSCTDNLEKLCEEPFIDIEGNGVTALFWIEIDSIKYLFKPLDEYNMWGELLSLEIAEKLGLKCAKYRAACFNNQIGVLSKNILEKDETLVLGCEIFQDFLNDYEYKNLNNEQNIEEFLKLYNIPIDYSLYKDYDKKNLLFNYLNNLEHIWAILSLKKDLSENDRRKIITQFEDMLLFDLVTLQGDRHANNLGIVKTKDGYKKADLLDNSAMLGFNRPDIKEIIDNFKNEYMMYKYSRDSSKINKIIYRCTPVYTLSEDNVIDYEKKLKDNSLKVLDDYLIKTGIAGVEKIEKIMSLINVDIIIDMIMNIEERNGIRMDDNLYNYIISSYEIHFENIYKIINKYKKRSIENEQGRSIKAI